MSRTESESVNNSASKGSYSVRIYREDLNFSSAHISTYGDLLEGQHGHNYQLSVEFRGPLNEDSLVVDFRHIKSILKKIKETLNHRTLVPVQNPHLKVQHIAKSTRIRFKEERIELPTRDVVLLEVENITSEILSFYIFDVIIQKLADEDRKRLETLSVEVIESPGQSGCYVGPLDF